MAGETVTILLADDMAHFLNLEQSFLRRADCRIVTAADGAEAVKLAKAEDPDLLLLDVEMPNLTGIEACRILRRDTQFSDRPIIMVTSTTRKEEAMKAGATEFWQKPIREDKFIEGIRRHVDIKIREDERVSVGLPVDLSFETGADANGMSRDVSRSGMFVLVDRDAEIGATVSVKLQLGFDNAPVVALDGVVARVQGGPDGGLGIAFSGPPDALQRVTDYLKTL